MITRFIPQNRAALTNKAALGFLPPQKAPLYIDLKPKAALKPVFTGHTEEGTLAFLERVEQRQKLPRNPSQAIKHAMENAVKGNWQSVLEKLLLTKSLSSLYHYHFNPVEMNFAVKLLLRQKYPTTAPPRKRAADYKIVDHLVYREREAEKPETVESINTKVKKSFLQGNYSSIINLLKNNEPLLNSDTKLSKISAYAAISLFDFYYKNEDLSLKNKKEKYVNDVKFLRNFIYKNCEADPVLHDYLVSKMMSSQSKYANGFITVLTYHYKKNIEQPPNYYNFVPSDDLFQSWIKRDQAPFYNEPGMLIPHEYYILPAIKLTNNLLSNASASASFYSAIERYNDHYNGLNSNYNSPTHHAKYYKHWIGYHSLLPELLLGLNNVEAIKTGDSGWYEHPSRAISSIYHYYFKTTQQGEDAQHLRAFTPGVLPLWSKLGILTHDFLRWKYDTKSFQTPYRDEPKTLFEHYGFERLKEDPVFHSGFLLTKDLVNTAQQNAKRPGSVVKRINLKEETTIVIRRGYILVSHPEHGTLVIRNSSGVFGRDLMKHPAYWAPFTLDASILKTMENFGPDRPGSGFKHLLEQSLYDYRKGEEKADPQPVQDMTFLTNELMTFREHYRHWKLGLEVGDGFDVFQKKDNQWSTKGNNRLGFLPLMQSAFLQGRQQLRDNPDKPLALAYVTKKRPLFTQKPYEVYTLNKTHLDEIRALLGNQERNKAWKDYQQSDWYSFYLKSIQYAHTGELVLIEQPKG